MEIPVEELTSQEVYKLLCGSVVPRPIAWVSSVSRDGVTNLAPFSFFTVASRQPPSVLVSIGRSDRQSESDPLTKDTLKNVRETGEFVVAVVPESLAEKMVVTGAPWPSNVNEFEQAGLSPSPSVSVRPPRVSESPINLECRLDRIVQIGTDHLVIGQVIHFAIDDRLVDSAYRINFDELRPLGRLAGQLYCRMGEIASHPPYKLPSEVRG